MNQKIDLYIENAEKWQVEMEKLRSILLDCLLTEELKWRVPCYTFNDKNIAIIGNFKDYCSISFFKGVLLKDTHKILVSPGENSQSVKLIKFRTLNEIIQLKATIKAYIIEAIEIEKAGLKVDFKKSKDLALCQELIEELITEFNKNKQLKTAFEALTPGRQRAYNLFFSAAKQSETRIKRIDKYKTRILKGFGINDCTCGLTKRKPNCDGSHKYI